MTEVYYIEDDKNIANIVKEYLEQKDYHVSIFSTLEEFCSFCTGIENQKSG